MVYPCKECDFKTTVPNDLKMHKKTVHQGIKMACPQCPYTAFVLKDVEDHIEMEHQQNKV